MECNGVMHFGVTEQTVRPDWLPLEMKTTSYLDGTYKVLFAMI